MSSTGVNIGISSETKSSSRVLKPPGGGHTDIFGPAEEKVQRPRAKNNQQNSTSMGEIMGKVETNGAPQEAPACKQNSSEPSVEHVKHVETSKPAEPAKPAESAGRVRVPPGGFSSGLW